MVPTKFQWAPHKGWDDSPLMRLTVPHHERRSLYLVKFRREHNEPAETLTPKEEAAGMMLFTGNGGVRHKHRPGHDTGSLRDIRAGHVLTWRLDPDDQIVTAFAVDFSGERTFEFDPAEPDVIRNVGTTFQSAECDTAPNSVRIRCGSTPGRGPMLGEDGLEDAYGDDVVERCLEDALYQEPCNGPPGKRLCEVGYERAPDGDWETVCKPWYAASVVRVERALVANEGGAR